jgi:hypothetical protein
MADMINIELGAMPWEPTRDSELVETYDYWDQPLAGVIRQHGQAFLFDCLKGVAESESLWAYTPLIGLNQEGLHGAVSDIRRLIREELRHAGGVTLALEREGSGIVATRQGDGQFVQFRHEDDLQDLEQALQQHAMEADLPVGY